MIVRRGEGGRKLSLVSFSHLFNLWNFSCHFLGASHTPPQFTDDYKYPAGLSYSYKSFLSVPPVKGPLAGGDARFGQHS